MLSNDSNSPHHQTFILLPCLATTVTSHTHILTYSPLSITQPPNTCCKLYTAAPAKPRYPQPQSTLADPNHILTTASHLFKPHFDIRSHSPPIQRATPPRRYTLFLFSPHHPASRVLSFTPWHYPHGYTSSRNSIRYASHRRLHPCTDNPSSLLKRREYITKASYLYPA